MDTCWVKWKGYVRNLVIVLGRKPNTIQRFRKVWEEVMMVGKFKWCAAWVSGSTYVKTLWRITSNSFFVKLNKLFSNLIWFSNFNWANSCWKFKNVLILTMVAGDGSQNFQVGWSAGTYNAGLPGMAAPTPSAPARAGSQSIQASLKDFFEESHFRPPSARGRTLQTYPISFLCYYIQL